MARKDHSLILSATCRLKWVLSAQGVPQVPLVPLVHRVSKVCEVNQVTQVPSDRPVLQVLVASLAFPERTETMVKTELQVHLVQSAPSELVVCLACQVFPA